MRSFRRDPITFLRTVAGTYGDIASFTMGGMSVVLLNHPVHVNEVLVARQRNFVKGRPLEFARHLIGEGLLTSDAPTHTRQRRIVQPAFYRDDVQRSAEVMIECAAALAGRWRDRDTIDIATDMRLLALTIAGRALCNIDLGDDAARIDRALLAASRFFNRFAIPFVDLLFKLPLPSTLTVKRSKRVLDSVVDRIVAARRGASDRDDLLSLLMRARERESLGVTETELRDQILVFLLAGYDTTASALAWSWYLLSQHPAAAAALHREIDSTLGGRLPTADDVPKLPYARSVFAEALRLYPPSYVIARRAVDEFELGGYRIPGGTTVFMSPFLIQRDPRFYDEPDSFKPERWLDGRHASQLPFSYFPFGGGARMCIGDHFAWTEATLVLAILAQRWELGFAAGQEVQCVWLLNMRPQHPMRMTVAQRQPAEVSAAAPTH